MSFNIVDLFILLLMLICIVGKHPIVLLLQHFLSYILGLDRLQCGCAVLLDEELAVAELTTLTSQSLLVALTR